MAEVVNVKNTELRGVTVADTKISFIDGEKGVLIYRGYRIEETALNVFAEAQEARKQSVLARSRN